MTVETSRVSDRHSRADQSEDVDRNYNSTRIDWVLQNVSGLTGR